MIADAQNYPALSRSLAALKGFYAIYEDLVKTAQEAPLDELFAAVIDRSGYRRMLEAQGEEGQSRLENLGELISSVKTYAQEQGGGGHTGGISRGGGPDLGYRRL